MSDPLVTVVVATVAPDREQLDRCLRSVLASEAVRVRLVVVDDGSPDQGRSTAAVVDALGPVHAEVLLRARNGGFAAAVNDGLRHRVGDHVLVLNDDAVVAPRTIARLVEVLEAQPAEVVAAAPVIHLLDEPDRIDSAGLVLRPNGEAFSDGIGQPDLGQFRTGEPCLGPCFAATLVRSRAFDRDQVGLLDERYRLYYEDVDWAVRATLSGRTTVLVADAGIRHGHARTTRRMGEARRYGLVQRNLLLFAVVNLSWRSVGRIWWGRVVVHAKGLVTGPFRVARVGALAGAVARVPAALPARSRRRHRVVLGDEAAFAFAVGAEPFFAADGYRAERSAAAEAAARARLEAGPR